MAGTSWPRSLFRAMWAAPSEVTRAVPSFFPATQNETRLPARRRMCSTSASSSRSPAFPLDVAAPLAPGNAFAAVSEIRVPPPPAASTAGTDTARTSANAARRVVMRFISNLLLESWNPVAPTYGGAVKRRATSGKGFPPVRLRVGRRTPARAQAVVCDSRPRVGSRPRGALLLAEPLRDGSRLRAVTPPGSDPPPDPAEAAPGRLAQRPRGHPRARAAGGRRGVDEARELERQADRAAGSADARPRLPRARALPQRFRCGGGQDGRAGLAPSRDRVRGVAHGPDGGVRRRGEGPAAVDARDSP